MKKSRLKKVEKMEDLHLLVFYGMLAAGTDKLELSEAEQQDRMIEIGREILKRMAK